MKNFGIVCLKCISKKRPDQAVDFHLTQFPDVNKSFLDFRCMNCGIEEIFYFRAIKDYTEAQKLQKKIKGRI